MGRVHECRPDILGMSCRWERTQSRGYQEERFYGGKGIPMSLRSTRVKK